MRFLNGLFNKKRNNAQQKLTKSKPQEAAQNKRDEEIEHTKEELDRITARLLKKARKMPERGTFSPISEAFIYKGRELYVGKVVISIEPSLLKTRPMKRNINLIVTSPSGLSNISQVIITGQKKDIIAALENGIYELLVEKIKNFSYDFKEGGAV